MEIQLPCCFKRISPLRPNPLAPATPAVRSATLAPWHWNKHLFGSVCKELVPEHMMDLKAQLLEDAGNPASLYQYWPLAKRTRPPFSILLPAEVRRRILLRRGVRGWRLRLSQVFVVGRSCVSREFSRQVKNNLLIIMVICYAFVCCFSSCCAVQTACWSDLTPLLTYRLLNTFHPRSEDPKFSSAESVV